MRLAAALLAVLALGGPATADPVPEPAGYRTSEYRGPVPDTLTGATVVDTNAAHALWQSGEAAFIDVLPQAPKPETLPPGTIWRDKPRLSIPGATWLPNVGYGELAEVNVDYFRAGLAAATDGDRDRPVVFFCLEDCWMSWNAAKRALEYGYTAVHWYPGGTDHWAFHDHPLEELDPVPGGK